MRLQASEAVTHERLIERQILRERLALEGAASTYRKIGAHALMPLPPCALKPTRSGPSQRDKLPREEKAVGFQPRGGC